MMDSHSNLVGYDHITIVDTTPVAKRPIGAKGVRYQAGVCIYECIL